MSWQQSVITTTTEKLSHPPFAITICGQPLMDRWEGPQTERSTSRLKYTQIKEAKTHSTAKTKTGVSCFKIPLVFMKYFKICKRFLCKNSAVSQSKLGIKPNQLHLITKALHNNYHLISLPIPAFRETSINTYSIIVPLPLSRWNHSSPHKVTFLGLTFYNI